jgi:hypothetical protein
MSTGISIVLRGQIAKFSQSVLLFFSKPEKCFMFRRKNKLINKCYITKYRVIFLRIASLSACGQL